MNNFSINSISRYFASGMDSAVYSLRKAGSYLKEEGRIIVIAVGALALLAFSYLAFPFRNLCSCFAKKVEDDRHIPSPIIVTNPNNSNIENESDDEMSVSSEESDEEDDEQEEVERVGTLNDRGFLEGEGRIIHTNGAQEIGTFKDDELHGKGKFVFPDGKVVEGTFNHGELEGEYTVTFNGTKQTFTASKEEWLKLRDESSRASVKFYKK